MLAVLLDPEVGGARDVQVGDGQGGEDSATVALALFTPRAGGAAPRSPVR